jgi:hypothetical protein
MTNSFTVEIPYFLYREVTAFVPHLLLLNINSKKPSIKSTKIVGNTYFRVRLTGTTRRNGSNTRNSTAALGGIEG